MHHHRYGGVAIAGGLVTNENLSSLTISANLLGAVAADALFRAMSKNSKVEYLNLHHNAIYDWEHPETVESLVAMLQTNDKLTRWGDRDRGGGWGGVCGGGRAPPAGHQSSSRNAPPPQSRPLPEWVRIQRGGGHRSRPAHQHKFGQPQHRQQPNERQRRHRVRPGANVNIETERRTATEVPGF